MSIGVQPFLDAKMPTPEDLERMKMFIALETDEDMPYLAKTLGGQNLVVGTDFGHNDLGTELGAHQTVLAREDVSTELATSIVDTNARRLLDIAPTFSPAPMASTSDDTPNVHAAAGGPAIIVPSWLRDRPRADSQTLESV
jgi:hypothetical protein